MNLIKLYDAELSGNAYKVRLFLSLLKLEHELAPVDLTAMQSRTPEFLKINPRGQIPVLVDGDVIVWDSQAILVYLARRYGEEWLPLDPESMGAVMQWMALSENELLFGLARARATKLFGRPFNLEECQAYGRAGLDVLEQRLTKHEWLACSRPTIADIACFPYVALCHQGGLSLDAFARVRAWIAHIQTIEGYIGMSGIQGAQTT
ncbi:MAG: glutathione S-transferase family protein [Gammaproteobacteria bacterium]